MTEPRPLHVWNDPDGDGHDCAACAPDSMWKCDEDAHFPEDPYGLLTDDQRAELDASLETDQQTRKAARFAAKDIPL